ncbi:hypothetical protein LCGC14_0329830 [marine sediment metagenome]|uniref:Uncharacterized protein n=1 Tax=marine sediment metagenome TaxID=412755 RepID=A0A0F9TGN6_9ZZZZ
MITHSFTSPSLDRIFRCDPNTALENFLEVNLSILLPHKLVVEFGSYQVQEIIKADVKNLVAALNLKIS